MVKTKSMRRVGAMFLAVVMMFTMAISASAVSVGSYTPGLVTGAPHPINIFDGSATVTNADGESTVKIKLQEMNVFGITGHVKAAQLAPSAGEDYIQASVVKEADGDYLYVISEESVNATDFAAPIAFTIVLNNSQAHMPVTGTLTLN